MKKHNALRRASGILLVLTLATSCFVGGTFAKYVSEGEATDTARVAKWGVKVKMAGDGFKTEYDKDDVGADFGGDNSVEADGSTEKITFTWNTNDSVKKDVSNVIAPGTEGNFGGYDGSTALPAISFSGQPEVAVKITTAADVSLGDKWGEGKDFYCPLVFTVTAKQDGAEIGSQTICGMHYNQSAGGQSSFENDIENAINSAISGDYPAKTALGNIEVYYSWEWPFENSKHSGHTDNFNPTVEESILTQKNQSTDVLEVKNTWSHNLAQDDEKDTELGDKAADGDAPGIAITVTTTVTQID